MLDHRFTLLPYGTSLLTNLTGKHQSDLDCRYADVMKLSSFTADDAKSSRRLVQLMKKRIVEVSTHDFAVWAG